MTGSLVGAGLSAVGSIFGGNRASKAIKNVKRNLEQRKEANANWFNRRYNEDATQRADAQRLLGITRENIRQRNRAAAGAQAIVGGTDASLETAREANNQALADASSQIAVNAGARKDNIEQMYQQNDAQINDALNNLEINKAQAVRSAVQGARQAGAGMEDAF